MPPRRAILSFFARTLLLAALAATTTPACLVFPLHSLSSSKADPHTWYQFISLGRGSVLRAGVDTDKGYKPCIELLGADKKRLFRHTYARFGEGGLAIFTAATELSNGRFLAMAGDQSITTTGAVAFSADGRLLWAKELDLPAPAIGRPIAIAAGDGAAFAVPIQFKAEKAQRTLVVRTDAAGAVVWAGTLPLGEARALSWTEEHGLTVLAAGPKQQTEQPPVRPNQPPPEPAADRRRPTLARISPSGELRWVVEIPLRDIRDGWLAPSIATTPDGGVQIAASVRRCETCSALDVTLARLGPTGALSWATRFRREIPRDPAQPPPPADREHPMGSVTQVATVRGDGTAIVALTVPAKKPRSMGLAVIEVGADGGVRSRRAFDASTDLLQSVRAEGDLVTVRGRFMPPCVLRPGGHEGCGASEWLPALPWTREDLDVAGLQIAFDPAPTKTRDVTAELAGLEQKDPDAR